MSKNFTKINYNNKYKNKGDNKKKEYIKNLLSKTLNNKNVLNSNKEKNSKKKSHRSISESELPGKIKDKYSDLSEEKLTIKTTLLKSKEKQNKDLIKEEPNKYHINFELLSNSDINDDININIAFI